MTIFNRKRKNNAILHLVVDHKLSPAIIGASEETPSEMHERIFPKCKWTPINQKE